MKQGRKIRLKGIMAVGLLSLVFSGKSLAQEDSVRINLDQAIEIALCDNPTIMIANNEIVINKYAKKEQIAGLFPNIDATGTFSHNLELQKQKMGFIEGGAVAFGQKNASTLTFNLSLPLVAPQLWKTIQLSQDEIGRAHV